MRTKRFRILFLAFITVLILCSCGVKKPKKTEQNGNGGVVASPEPTVNEVVDSAVEFDRKIDSYMPKKKHYNFYFTYKMIHPWWDAVAIGIENAADQYAELGVTIEYDYLAPKVVDVEDQKRRILTATDSKEYDVIGVDVVNSKEIAPVIDKAIDKGQKVITFSSSDTAKRDKCKRYAYVGNCHNQKDGEMLAIDMCNQIDYRGKIAIIAGDKNTLCQEERLAGVKKIIERYENIEIVGVEYDDESEQTAEKIADQYLKDHPDLGGMICLDMVSPVGAGNAVKKRGKAGKVKIAGMDHDERSLKMLQNGVISCLGVQDCSSIGFDTVQVAIKIADGVKPGRQLKKMTDEKTTLLHRGDAAGMLYKLYGTQTAS